ncbi:MAG: hypothetical protein K0S46_215 [Moraxellaceae bacterium]|jgi:alpha-1,3-rhamnosyltransferase|nr:hypothetical protein [Moraxellaceae bacterium]
MNDILNTRPLVSVALPCYNHERYVQQCIQSIIDQDYQNIELIIVDDGSRDGSVEKIREMLPACEARFTRFEFRSRPNVGLSATLAEVLPWCQGEYFAAVASDDAMLPHKTRLEVDYLDKHPGCAAVFGGVQIADDAGNIVREERRASRSFDFDDIFLLRHFLKATTQLIRLDDLKAIGPFPAGIIMEDWYMCLKLAASGKSLDNLHEVVSIYRRHEGNLSKQIDLIIKGRQQIVDLFREHPLYDKAVGKTYIANAAHMELHDKGRSLPWFFRGLGKDPALILERASFMYLVKLFLPQSTIRKYAG